MNGESGTGNVPGKWQAAALDLGYHTRRLWSLLQSVWAEAGEGLQSAEDSLVGVHHAMLALDGRLNQAEFAQTRNLLNRVDELQAESFEFVNGLKAEIFRTWNVKISEINYSGLHERTELLLPGMIEERRGLWDSKMASVWDELLLLTHRAVLGDDLLTAWWEIGFRLADIPPADHPPGSPFAVAGGGIGTMEAAVLRLPPVVRPELPGTLDAVQLRTYFLKCRDVLLRHTSPPTTLLDAAEFTHDPEYRVVRWHGQDYTFNAGQAAIIKALHQDHEAGKPGLSAETLFSKTNRFSSPRLRQVFRTRDKKANVWIEHPALTDGLLVQVGAVWRLNLETR